MEILGQGGAWNKEQSSSQKRESEFSHEFLPFFDYETGRRKPYIPLELVQRV
jgi:hypothetical protein